VAPARQRQKDPHNLRYQAVLFDLDGTLIDSADDLVASVKHALLHVDARRPPPDDVILMEIGKPLEVMLGDLGYPNDEATAADFAASYRDHYAVHFSDHTRPFPSARDALAFLREAGAKLALVTTKHQTQAEFVVEAMGLRSFFAYVHGWKEGRRHKPDPEPVRIALEKLGARPGEALMVGDSEQDMIAAKAAGVPTCAVTYGFRPLMLLRALRPDYMVSRIADLVHIVVSGS
jgi:2-phosphoglycolate phosphatase